MSSFILWSLLFYFLSSSLFLNVAILAVVSLYVWGEKVRNLKAYRHQHDMFSQLFLMLHLFLSKSILLPLPLPPDEKRKSCRQCVCERESEDDNQWLGKGICEWCEKYLVPVIIGSGPRESKYNLTVGTLVIHCFWRWAQDTHIHTQRNTVVSSGLLTQGKMLCQALTVLADVTNIAPY